MGKDNVSIRLETKQVYSISHLLFNTALGVLAHAIKPEKNKSHPDQKGKINFSYL